MDLWTMIFFYFVNKETIAVLSHSLMIRFFYLSRCLVANNAIMIIVAVTRHDTIRHQHKRPHSSRAPKTQRFVCILVWYFVSMSHECNFTAKDTFRFGSAQWMSHTHRRNIPFGRGVESRPNSFLLSSPSSTQIAIVRQFKNRNYSIPKSV